MADTQTHTSTQTSTEGSPSTALEPGTAPAALESGTSQAISGAAALAHQVSRVVLGNPEPIRLSVSAFLAGGHLLVEDMPGVGKTLLAKALARSIGACFGRLQGTADLLPSDVTGVNMFEPTSQTWNFRPGPIFNSVVLFDELNRATPRTQSALLEAMAEGQVTVDGTTRELPHPFFVIATQNPHGDLGTFPLVQGQRDRFAMVLSLGLVDREVERNLLRGEGGMSALDHTQPVIDTRHWEEITAGVEAVFANDAIYEYILEIATALRSHPEGRNGISPRATLTLLRSAKAYAITGARDFVEPDDVKSVAVAVLAHRIGDMTTVDLQRATDVLHEILATVAVPPPTGAA